MSKRRHIIIAYDISCPKIWRKIYAVSKQWRLDGQKSVHECRLTHSEAEELFLQLTAIMDHEKDKLMMAWVDGHCPIIRGGRATSVIDKEVLHL